MTTLWSAGRILAITRTHNCKAPFLANRPTEHPRGLNLVKKNAFALCASAVTLCNGNGEIWQCLQEICDFAGNRRPPV